MTRPPTEAASNGLWTRWRTVFFAANFDFWPLVPISATRNVNLVLYGRDTYETAAFAKTKARTERVNQIAVDAVVSYVGVSNWRDPRGAVCESSSREKDSSQKSCGKSGHFCISINREPICTIGINSVQL
jgi:hypothetical protein